MRRWGVDDWFRPARWEGRPLRARPALTRRDRSWAWAVLALCAAVLAGVLALVPERGYLAGGFVGVSVVQLLVLFRTRHLSRFARRS